MVNNIRDVSYRDLAGVVFTPWGIWMRLSIIVPVFNAEKYLHDSIQSILNQTFNDYELIIINDGSIDDSLSVIKSFSDDRIRFIDLSKNMNKWSAGPINLGLSQSAGEYVTWISADDFLATNAALEILVSELDNNNEIDLVSGSYQIVDRHGNFVKVIDKPTHILAIDEMFSENCICASFMFRRKIIDTIGLMREDMVGVDDWDYWIRVARSGFVSKKLSDVLMSWRDSGENMTTVHEAKCQENLSRLNKRIESFVIVTALFEIPGKRIDYDAYVALFNQLAESDISIILFLDESLSSKRDILVKRANVTIVPFEQKNLLTQLIVSEYSDLALPQERNPEKDTREFLAMMNSKVDFLLMAADVEKEVGHFAWLDFAVLHVVPQQERDSFLEQLRSLQPPAKCLFAPGIWPRQTDLDGLWSKICWRFCGGFLLADRQSLLSFGLLYYKVFKSEIMAHGALTWETNIWALMEAKYNQHFDWYKSDHNSSLVNIPKESQKNRVCLNMIVKNESAIIERCLTSTLPLVDAWVICDTGSSDGTVDIIKEFFSKRNIPGKIVSTAFQNFSQARNEALIAARDFGNVYPFDYILLVDADMILEGALDKSTLTADAYQMRQIGGELSYYNTRLVRRDSVGSKYIGVTHEYLDVPVGNSHNKLESPWIADRGDGGSKSDKVERDIRLLNQGLVDNPKSERYMFYLAQSYKDSGRFHEAINWYRRRIESGNWDEEVWASYYGIAMAYLALNDEPNFVKACLDAYNYRPSRSESLYRLAKFYRDKGQNHIGAAIAEVGAKIKYPEDVLFVEKNVYDYGFDEEMSIVGFYGTGERRDSGYRSCARLTVHQERDVRELANKNFVHYVKSSDMMFGARIIPIHLTPSNNYLPMNPSIFIDTDTRIAVVRAVNYTVTKSGQYPTTDNSGIIKTKNYIVTFKGDWNVDQAKPMEDLSGLARTTFPVEGFEDCRIFKVGETLYCSATVRNLREDGRCEIVILKLDENWNIVQVTPVRDYEETNNQKNWMPVIGTDWAFVYSMDQTIIVRSEPRTKTVETFRSSPSVCLANLRGGSQVIPFEEGWICLTHEVTWNPHRVYLHRFVSLDQKFMVTRISDPFYFGFKGIEFCAGLARDGKTLVASFGVNDESAHLAIFEEEIVSKLLYPVKQ